MAVSVVLCVGVSDGRCGWRYGQTSTARCRRFEFSIGFGLLLYYPLFIITVPLRLALAAGIGSGACPVPCGKPFSVSGCEGEAWSFLLAPARAVVLLWTWERWP